MDKKIEFKNTLLDIRETAIVYQGVFSHFETTDDELIYDDMLTIINGVNMLLKEIRIGTFNSVFEEKYDVHTD